MKKIKINDNILMQFFSAFSDDDVDQLKNIMGEDILPDVHIPNYNGNSLVHFASARNAVNCVAYLFSQGADIFVKNSEGDTPLMFAVNNGASDAIRFLIENGEDPNERCYKGGNTLFGLADSMTNENVKELAELLIELGADVNHKNDKGTPLIIYVCNEAQPILLSTLLPHISDINIKDSDGRTALDFAELYTEKNGLIAIEILKRNGAVNGVGFTGKDRPSDWRILQE